ncbi:hypothetical protein AVEN_95624-1 [Araneus ventricosus]|uniref:Uncharacterized protein n=1 Tax=Araneus ventricosus TaxID=182803 RepID=A0A4Y2JRD4_ARAVE|nr:hypothetical protein AVEN_95624-1 [Araneus ventricosus]
MVGIFAGGGNEYHLTNEETLVVALNGDFGCLRTVGLQLHWRALGFSSDRDSQCSRQGYSGIFTDRPGPRAHLVGVYIELQDFIEFSSKVQFGFAKVN